MNITDFQRTPMVRVFEAVAEIAARHGSQATTGELIGLIPEAAYEPKADWVRQTPGFDPATRVLERRLRAPLEWP
jgi:glutamate formiminotransferase